MAVINGKWLSKEGLTYFWSKIKAIFTKQTETNVIANLGAKNLLKVASTTQTVNGVTFTVNDDQTITVNGTASATITYVIAPNAQVILIPDGTYVLSGCPSGGGATTFDLRWYLYSSGKSAYDQGSGASVAKDGNTTSSNVAIVIKSGVTANNLVFKPMVRPAEITDDTFEPYAKTNVDLTNENENQQLEINYAINTGAKNLLNFDVCSAASTGGVSYTVNADGTITVNGTPQGTGPSYVQLMLRNDAVRVEEFCDGSHILSGCPSGGSDSSYRMYVAKGSYSRFDYGNGVLLTKTTLTDIRVVIYIAKGYTANNLVFKPMIRPVEITDGTFEPYAPTNRELYETRFGSKVILRDNVDLNYIKTGGIYNGVNSTGNSAVHMPVATGSFNFVLTVIEANEFIIQIFKQLNSAGDPNLYIRRFYIYNSDWDSWYQFTGTQV